jgi:hypothetical protein
MCYIREANDKCKIEITSISSSKDLVKRMKINKPQTGRKYLKIICLMKHFYS